MFSNSRKQNVWEDKHLRFSIFWPQEHDSAFTVQWLGVLGLWSGEPSCGLVSPVFQLAQYCSHAQGNTYLARSPSHNGYKYDSWNLPHNRQVQYSQQAGGEQLSTKETPAEVGMHCFLLMFITVPKSGKNRIFWPSKTISFLAFIAWRNLSFSRIPVLETVKIISVPAWNFISGFSQDWAGNFYRSSHLQGRALVSYTCELLLKVAYADMPGQHCSIGTRRKVQRWMKIETGLRLLPEGFQTRGLTGTVLSSSISLALW